jgi:DNA-binding winged helix-turn-helix (wHTH) protein
VSIQKLIIFKFKSLYHILEELSLDLNFKIIFVDNEKFLKDAVEKFHHYLIISDKKYSNISNQFVLNITPINISQLVEKINIEFLKIQFSSQSELKINNYIINLNSRELHMKSTKLRLTEKEINTIVYLSRSVKPVSVEELKEQVWSYQSDVETHTVETHIYRLRKKILNIFNDSQFILSEKNGYQIKKHIL